MINSNELLNIIRFYANYKLEKNGLYTLSYVTAFTHLWDLIAVDDDVRFDATEIRQMLQALEILPDDIRIIFLNYYHEYIRYKIKQTEIVNSLNACTLQS